MGEEISTDLNAGSSNGTSNSKLQTGLCILGLSALSALIGGSAAVSAARKKQDEYYKTLEASELNKIQPKRAAAESGVSLAFRALGWATLISVTGVSLISCAIWKWSGARSLSDFKEKMKEKLPRITKVKKPIENEPEIKEFSDLITYLRSQSNTNSKK